MEPTFVVGSTVLDHFVFRKPNVHLMCDILKMKFKCSTFIRFSITVITASLTANSIWFPMFEKLNASCISVVYDYNIDVKFITKETKT